MTSSSSSSDFSELALDWDELEQQLKLGVKGSREVPNHANLKVVDMGHGDIELQIKDTIFKTHTHLLVKFTRLRALILHGSSGTTSTRPIPLDPGERGVEDMVNTFKILYASVISGPFEFELPVLLSAFRIATTYDNPALRAFSIERLKGANLPPIQRIQLAREFSLASWEEATYDELCKRDEALTDEEAQFLGMTEFARIARMREEEKLKKGKEIREQEYKAEKASEEAKTKGEITRRRTVEAEQWLENERDRLERQRLETEKKEIEERVRGYEAALREYQEKKDKRGQEGDVSETEDPPEGSGTAPVGKGTKDYGALPAKTSTPVCSGNYVLADSPSCSEMLARRLAMIGLASKPEGPEPLMDTPGPEGAIAENPMVFDHPYDTEHDDGGDLD